MKQEFLIAVLGARGAAALDRLSEIPGAADVVPPRVAISWLAKHTEFEGAVPGCRDLALVFQKSEVGYTGVLGRPSTGEQHIFASAPIEHVAAAVCAYIGVEPGFGVVKHTDMARLGRTIDLLVKAQIKPAHSMAPGMTRERRPMTPTRRAVPVKGASGVPKAPEEHAEPTAAAPASVARKPKLQKLQLKLTKAHASRPCAVCDGHNFVGDVFVGCPCFVAMAKSVKTEVRPWGYLLSFGAAWDRDAVSAILGAVDEV